MSSPPLTPPPPESPDSTPPASPSSSPIISPPVKRPRWQVFGFREGKSQPCSRTILRWQDRGLVQGLDTVKEGENIQEVENSDRVNNVLEDSDCDSVYDSSESEPPSDTQSAHGSISDDSHDNSSQAENRWYDSDDEIFHEEVLLCDNDDGGDDKFVPLYPGSKYCRDEAILDLLDDFFNNRESQKSLKDHLATFVKYLPKNNTMPKSVYLLFQYLKKLAPSYIFNPKYYCSNCLLYIANSGEHCSVCGEISQSEFYIFDLEEQVRFYFEHYDLSDLIDKYQGESHSDDKITDIRDGSEYKRVKVEGDYNINLIWNTDGVSLSKSSKCSLYPVLATICELPPCVRSRFILVIGVWCDKTAPPMNTLLLPFCEALIAINDKGGVSWRKPQSGEQFKSDVNAPLCIADGPVRAQVQNIKSHTSKHACNTCEQKSESLPLTAAQLAARAAGDKKIKKKRAYLYEEYPARLRTGPRMVKQAKKAFFEQKSVKGVLGPSILQKVPRLDLGTCVLAEYMHGACLGVSRKFANILINERGGPWYIGNKVDEIDNFLESIKPCDYICRLPRKISELCKWKASELRAWLLFYSVLVFNKFLPRIYAQHWMLFVMSIWLLLQESITEFDLQKSEEMLKLFVKDIGRLYSPSCYVYNTHQILHLPLYVRRWGPLWATSAFFYESYNGTIAELVHGTKNRAKELVNLLQIYHGLQILRENVQLKWGKRGDIKCRVELGGECKHSFLSNSDKNFLVGAGVKSPFKIFSHCTVKKEKFTSLLSKENKRINFCIGFEKEGKKNYGEIKFFITIGSEELAVVKCFKIDQLKIFCHENTRTVLKHILPVTSGDRLQLVTVRSLFKVLKTDSYICIMPNLFEKNL